MSTPTPKKLTPAQQLAEARAQRKAQYYQDKTPDDAKKKALDYQEKKQIERELHEEGRKFEIQTELATRQISGDQKKQDAEYVHRLRLGVELDKKERAEEEKAREEKLARIRATKAAEAQKKEEERLAKIAAFQAAGGVRPDGDKKKDKNKKDKSDSD